MARRGGPSRPDGRTGPLAAAARHRADDQGRSRVAFAGRPGGTACRPHRPHRWNAGRTTPDLPADPFPPIAAGTAGTGRRVPRDLLDSEVPLRELIAMSDPLGVGVLRAARRQGRRPRTHVAVTGAHGAPPMSRVDGGQRLADQDVNRWEFR